jgi:hypothetical protein
MGFFAGTSSRSGRVRLGVLAMTAASALACHYFEDDSGSSITSTSLLEGRWAGTLKPVGSPPDDLELEFDVVSNITSVTRDGTDLGLTGTVRFSDPSPPEPFARLYDFEFVDGSGAMVDSGSFYIDDRFNYGLLIYSNGDFAVLQQGSMLRPTAGFANEDLEEKMTSTRVLGVYVRWTDTSLLDEAGDWEIRTWPVSSATDPIPYEGMIGGDIVKLGPPFQSSEVTLEGGIAISGEFTNFDPMGVWEDLDADEPSGAHFVAIMSFDKEFVGTFECDPINGFPECVFSLWTPLLKMKPKP